jgi:hypothetical protein
MLRERRFIPVRGALAVLAALAILILAPGPGSAKEKLTVGATEVIHVVDANLDFVARIDTGARTTSINAQNIEIENPAADKKANLGKTITLDVINAKGEKRRIKSKIVKVLEVRNAQGTELRYMIPLTLRWHGIDKLIRVNLRDRSAMTYKLLIGRDWLMGDFVVDVEKNPGGRKK